jgi:hypothetical protein
MTGKNALKRNEWEELQKWASFTPLAATLLPSGSPRGVPIVVAKTPIAGKLWVAARTAGALTSQDRWTPQDCGARVKERFGLDVAAVLNLCNTSKYYGDTSWGDGVLYFHSPVRGRISPSETCLQAAVDWIHETRRSLASSAETAGTSCVLVHCTHGVNRSGAVCTAYMRGPLGIGQADAESAFSRARSYQADEGLCSRGSSSASLKRAADADWNDEDGGPW